ncbi:MAG: orotidine-5'-phosphate decarboxylase [Candidatus Portiera sp.]|nr:orotidine-5'-phosphate decarboxylase [Portiera sp.]
MTLTSSTKINPSDRIIYALDFSSTKDACQEIDRIYPEIVFFKVGLELFLASGWEVVDYIIHKGGKVMLDLKFLDIPATVASAVKQVNQHQGISLLTVHGHKQTIEAAVAARENQSLQILGVTLLTSFGPSDMLELVGQDNFIKPQDLVLARAKSSLDAGADGLVASAMEAKQLRQSLSQNHGSDFVLVTPGIRLLATAIDKDDQQRIATPQEALAQGSDYLVIGRPIRTAKDPIAIIQSIKALL